MARGFNPRPPITAGESCFRQRVGGTIIVSIRARQLRRANPVPVPVHAARSSGFNPRPPITAGESLVQFDRATAPSRFNPRPPITAGESDVYCSCEIRRTVSIRARQLRRANQTRAIRYWIDFIVSIRARQLRRANPAQQADIISTARFQSAPANYGGRITR